MLTLANKCWQTLANLAVNESVLRYLLYCIYRINSI